MHIDGAFEGQMRSQSEVVIGQNGKVEGEIQAHKVIISGEINGTVKADTVDILPGGKLFGEVEALNLIIEPKGIFEGNSKVMREVVSTEEEDIADTE